MTTRLSGIALAMVIGAWSVAACGSDDGKKASPAKEEDEKVEGAVACGAETCVPEKDFMGQMCCQSDFEGLCGQMVAGTCIDLPPKAYKGCDSASFMAGGITVQIPSCCSASNECGLVFNAGIGAPVCTSITEVQMRGAGFMAAARMGGMNENVDFTGSLPKAVTCDGKPIEASAAGSGG